MSTKGPKHVLVNLKKRVPEKISKIAYKDSRAVEEDQ